MFESEEFPGFQETDVAAFVDPRTSFQGIRILCAAESFETVDDVKILTNPNKEYKTIRMALGIPEGKSEMGGQYPLNVGLHLLSGVSFDKGCYIG